MFGENDISPKEEELIRISTAEKKKGCRILVYTTYTGRHDTATRLKDQLTQAGLKTAALSSLVDIQ